jgi:hypothetical protein
MVIVEAACEFLQIIFDAQICSFKPLSCDPVCVRRNTVCKFYRQITGITTGLSCATQVANAFLLSFDREIARILASNLWLHKRFVDDVLIVSTQYNRLELLDICNSWCPGIVVTNDELQTDTATTFLDDRT